MVLWFTAKQRLNSIVAGEFKRIFPFVDGGNTVNSFVMLLKTLWNMVVPPGNMAGTCKFTWMSTSHFMTFWKRRRRVFHWLLCRCHLEWPSKGVR